MAEKYGIGIQSFEKIRTLDYTYIDKTALIYKLASEGMTYFLSRPRRFGKSLLISTMEAFFSGHKELFNGLAIEKLEDECPVDPINGAWVNGPVIHLDFNTVDSTNIVTFRNSLNSMLCVYENKWGRSKADVNFSDRFLALMRNMYKKTGVRVAVLIDEYDKPLLNTMFDDELNERIRTELKIFYSALKSADDYTKFAFLTGVTKFSHVSIFSDLNQLQDISLMPDYNEICGITDTELRDNFKEGISELAEAQSMTEEAVIEKLADWYDGYCFSYRGQGIYNPFSVLNVMKNKMFDNYWFNSATPTFLVETVKRTNYDIRRFTDGIPASADSFMSYRANLTEPLPLFYQSGYLTIKSYNTDRNRYMLAFPNDEVRYGFLNNLLPVYFDTEVELTSLCINEFIDDIDSGNIDGFMTRLEALLASVPYDDSRNEDKLASYEHTFSTAVHLIFTLCGKYYRSEVHTINGRCDAVLETYDKVYIFEFKMLREGTADDALRQIDEKGYYKPYIASNKELVKIGIAFDSERRNVAEYKVQ